MSTPTTVKEAAAACRAAFAAHPDAARAWCCHHRVRMEPLSEPAENRIFYILSAKPEHERVTRLNNFRPVLWDYPQVWYCPEYRNFLSSPECDATHLADVPHHTWNGKDIF